MGMRLASLAVGLVAISVSALAEADQAAWIDKKDAEAGAAMVIVGQELRGYCAPCRDTAYSARTVSSVTVAQPRANYWEVRVNGRGVDLAYEYVLQNGKWINLATAIGLTVHGVPAEFPATLPRK